MDKIGKKQRIIQIKGLIPNQNAMYGVLEYIHIYLIYDRLCGLVVRVSGYRYRGPGFDPRRYQIF